MSVNFGLNTALQIGDIVKFGQYPQGANGEVEPIEWLVLDVKDGKALLLTDKLLDRVLYDEKRTGVTWETCALRKWMNNDFIGMAFNSDAQSKIATVTNFNPDNPKYGTKGGNSTQDKVFTLSIDEVEGYFSSDKSMIAKATAYAVKMGAWFNKNSGNSYWWLRSSGLSSNHAAIVNSCDGISIDGHYVNCNKVAVRLALCVNL